MTISEESLNGRPMAICNAIVFGDDATILPAEKFFFAEARWAQDFGFWTSTGSLLKCSRNPEAEARLEKFEIELRVNILGISTWLRNNYKSWGRVFYFSVQSRGLYLETLLKFTLALRIAMQMQLSVDEVYKGIYNSAAFEVFHPGFIALGNKHMIVGPMSDKLKEKLPEENLNPLFPLSGKEFFQKV